MSKNTYPSDYITISDMYLAYRKAKTDAYYEKLHPSAQSFAEFESSLQTNLERLHKIITEEHNLWWENLDFIGSYLYVPKSIDDAPWDGSERTHYRSIDPITDWKQRFQDSGKVRLESKYRLIIVATAEYHILSALWILKVGHKFERMLDKNLSYGNRLSRQKHMLEEFGFNGSVNKDSLRLFSPYFSAYRTWRQKGLDAMRSLVENGLPATAITMDLAGFYHNVSPSFILKRSFLNTIGVELAGC
ncbi:MAG: hypothetical protein ABW095_02675 [Candidatus Thiodiazotropha sp.]